ncbi:MAG TPA: DUF58 domain-containing protein [Acidimicrobiales bacterium]|nr:DUF58 domain-containing protein [Acidimicrobiales bacterium]
MTKRASPRLFVYATLVALGLISGLVTQRVDLFVYTTPFVILLLVGLALDADPGIDVHTSVDTIRTLEGDPLEVVITLRSPHAVRRVEMALPLPQGVRIVDGANVRAVELVAGEARTVPVTIVADRWGSHSIGAVVIRAHDRASLYRYERTVPAPSTVRVYPHQHRIRPAAHPSRTQLVAGDRVARRAAGEGIELADLRLFLPGDRPRDINWRASARRNELWITQRHPERSTDIVLFVDMFSDTMLLPAVRAAGALTESYLATRDRVALVGFGGLLQWVRAGHGVRQLYRLLDTLVDARAYFSYADKNVNLIPPRVLSPGALVIAITPLEDERTTRGLVDLRARGFEVAVIELSAPAASIPDDTELDAAARQLWLLQRADNRERFRQYGIPVAEWRDGEPLNSTMEALWDAWAASGARHHASRAP